MPMEPIFDFEIGSLTWNTDLLQWEGRGELPHCEPFDLFISTPAWEHHPNIDEENPDTSITTAARAAFRDLARLETVARAGILADYALLYPTWNESEQISVEDFSKRLTLQWVHLTSVGETEFGYDDDGMFAGHALVGHVSSSGVYDHGELSG
jgi:hypothetical protein